MLSRLQLIVFALLLAGCLETCYSMCDDIRSIRNTNGQLEICERNTSSESNDNSWFHVCAEPTPALISSLLCRETDCERFCNRFNYTISHLPTNITGYEFDCEIVDTRPRQCDSEIVMCDSIINTLNCECDVNCPSEYTDSGFCATNECDCRTGFTDPDCVEMSDTDLPTTTTIDLTTTSVPLASIGSTSHFVALIPTPTISVLNSQITHSPTNQTSSNVTIMAVGSTPFSKVWIAVSACFFGIVLFSAILLVCVLLLVYYIRTRSTELKGLERRIIFTNQNNPCPHNNELTMRAGPCNTCTDDDDTIYASIILNGMLENCTDGNDFPAESRYSSGGVTRRSTEATQYLSPSLNPTGTPESSRLDDSTLTREFSDTLLGNVDNVLYSQIHALYSTYEALGTKPHLLSTSVVLSHQQRVADAQALKLGTGEVYFSKQEVFVEPPSEVDAIFDCMSQNRFREINEESIVLHQKIGSGCFGEVKLAEWRVDPDSDPLPVAVKLLNEKADDQLRVSFLKEAAIMGQFQHPNVLQLLGIVSLTQPFMLVMELMESDLRTILESLGNVKFDSDRLALSLLKSTREIVCGMAFLSSKHYVHRDLAVRNVLVGQDKMCRISDFGMSKRIHEDKDYYKVERGTMVPVRWTAPEAIFYRRYSEKSDVWSLGMTLFEVWSVGRKPWCGYTNEEVMGMISTDQKQGPPTGCPYEIYSLMVSAWHSEPDQRPTFRQLSELLNRSEEQLLRIPEEVRSTPMARQLGNDPCLTADLYSELRS